MLGFINWNEFSPIETKVFHVNRVTEGYSHSSVSPHLLLCSDITAPWGERDNRAGWLKMEGKTAGMFGWTEGESWGGSGE